MHKNLLRKHILKTRFRSYGRYVCFVVTVGALYFSLYAQWHECLL